MDSPEDLKWKYLPLLTDGMREALWLRFVKYHDFYRDTAERFSAPGVINMFRYNSLYLTTINERRAEFPERFNPFVDEFPPYVTGTEDFENRNSCLRYYVPRVNPNPYNPIEPWEEVAAESFAWAVGVMYGIEVAIQCEKLHRFGRRGRPIKL